MIGYRHLISIDTIHIKIKLKKSEITRLLNVYEFQHLSYKQNEIYQYAIKSDDKSIYIKLCKTVPGSTFNSEIQLQRGFTTRNGKVNQSLTADVLALLNENQNYWISRIDFAFDYLIPFKRSFSIKRHGNQKRQAIGEGYYFNGSTKNKKKPAVHSHYNRNNKEKEKVLYSNRFEVKLFFEKSKGMRFNNINHSLIVNELRKEIFVADIGHVQGLTAKEKDLILKSKREGTENCLQMELSKKEYTQFRKKIKVCREPLEQTYLDNSHLIYDFLLT